MLTEAEKLDRLIAAQAIRDLKSRYFRFVDTHDWDGLATIFCADAEFDTTRARGDGKPLPEGGEVSKGRDAILQYIVQGMRASSSVHHGHGHEITFVSNTEASGVIAMEDWVTWEGPPRFEAHGFGHYHEIYRIEDGEWRIWRSALTRLRVAETSLRR